MVDVDVTGLPSNIIKNGSPVNIASEVRNKSDVCPSLAYPFVIVVLAKPDNTKLPAYIPVEGATINITYGILSKTLATDLNGIAVYCRSRVGIIAGAVRVKKDGVDFGNGYGVYSDYKNLSVLIVATRKFITFNGTIKIPCPTAKIPVATSNFNRLDSRPSIFTQPLKANYEGYGGVDVGGSFRLFIGGVQVGSGTVQPGSRIDHTLPTPLKDLGNIKDMLGKSVQVRVEIDHGGCTFTGEQTVSIPSLAVPCYGELGLNLDSVKDELARFAKLPSSLNVPVFITNARGDIGSTEIEVYVGSHLVGSTFAGRSIDLIGILKDRVADIGKTNQITLKPKSKCIEARTFDIPALKPIGISVELPCTVWETQAKATISQTKLQYPFSTYITGAKWVCRDTGKSIPVDGVDAEVFIGAMRFTIPIKSGLGSLALRLEDIKDIIAGGAETIAPEMEAPARVTAECDKTGRVESAVELQAWLSICFQGKGYRVVDDGSKWLKIIRRDGSHTRGVRYQDIREDLRRNP
jgi:hypothetical protein